ncbi:MAG: hypothetical protein FJ090_07035 [Deltaproteobacteria bacterium]|nr:hypothetical protein [Deltaproteobacteria bacterium]
MMLSLLACFTPTPTPTDTAAADTADTAADTADTEDTGEEEEEILFTKYKVDDPSSVQGVYSSGSGVYLVSHGAEAWVGSASEDWDSIAIPAELAGLGLNDLWGTGKDDALELAIAADDGWVATYAAAAWTVWNIGSRDNLGISGNSATDLVVVGDNGLAHFDGSAWTMEATPGVTMNDVWAYSTGAYAVGDEGAVYRRDADGNWSISDTGRDGNFHAVSGSGASDVWLGGDQGAILHWDGGDWETPDTGTKNTINAVFVAEEDNVIAVGNTGTALKWGGKSWKVLTTDTNQNLYAVHGVSGANAWAAGDGGLVMQYKEE